MTTTQTTRKRSVKLDKASSVLWFIALLCLAASIFLEGPLNQLHGGMSNIALIVGLVIGIWLLVFDGSDGFIRIEKTTTTYTTTTTPDDFDQDEIFSDADETDWNANEDFYYEKN